MDDTSIALTLEAKVRVIGGTIPQCCLRIASLRLSTSGSGIAAITTLETTRGVGRHLPAHVLVLLWGASRASATISLLALLRKAVVVLETHCLEWV